MKQHLTAQKLVLTLALLACSICIFSFRQNDTTEQKTFRKESSAGDDDTTTRRKRNRSGDEFHLRDLEMSLRHLDEQMVKLDQQMKKLDFTKMEKEISAASKINSEKMAKEIEASLAKIDWTKMEIDARQAAEKIKNIDMAKLKEDMNKMKADLKKQDFEIKIDAEKIKKDVSKAMEEAKGSIEKARGEITLMRDFTNELQKDKLIDKKKPFKIEVKSGELYIDGQKQPKNVSDKYKKYFKKDDFTITSDGKDDEGVAI